MPDRPLHDLGRWALHGVPTELRIFQLGPGEHPPLRTENRHRGNLPRWLHRLVGRDDELARIRTALASHRLVSLVGPGGIGKTSLALAAAHQRAPTTGWLVELATITSPADVPRAVAEALGVTERHGADLTRSILDRLQTSPGLLVLDNCEHVVDAAAPLTARVLTGCPEIRVLVTSRERLGLTDERVITVPPLDPDPSVALFAGRARALDPRSTLRATRAPCWTSANDLTASRWPSSSPPPRSPASGSTSCVSACTTGCGSRRPPPQRGRAPSHAVARHPVVLRPAGAPRA